MQYDEITFLSYIVGGVVYSLLALIFILDARTRPSSLSFVIASIVSAILFIQIAYNYNGYTISKEQLIITETLRYGCWIAALLLSLNIATQGKLSKIFRASFYLAWIVPLTTYALLTIIEQGQLIQNNDLLIWNNLSLSVVCLVATEQFFRNTEKNRFQKLLSVGFAGFITFDIYLFSYSLIANRLEPELWQARGAITALASLIIVAAAFQLKQIPKTRKNINLSRPVVFYTTSITAAGTFFLLVSLGGYYVQLYGGSWATILKLTLIFGAAYFIAALSLSTVFRAKLTVWINKNLFHHKYDYRKEWLKLIKYLSQPVEDEDIYSHALHAFTDIMQCQGGCIWIRKGELFSPVYYENLQLSSGNISEKISSQFINTLEQHEWVYAPNANHNPSQTKYNRDLPLWVFDIPNVWIIAPLHIESTLKGFILLSKNEPSSPLSWEDLDLLKTLGRQIANYLDRHETTEQLTQARQFDTFNKLTAFIMHDLKNLIAQQRLVVENAAKHKENPAFVEDAIQTIDNSVGRMSNLLKKLQQNEPSDLRSLSLHKVLIDACKRCKDTLPRPTLRLNDNTSKIKADKDHLAMVLTHMIKNAQEATNNDGFVDVSLHRQGDNAIITIEDNGQGMSPEFIKNRLFKPFDTTKSGKGMGIGVYQTREFIISLEGNIRVNSQEGDGTIFTITLPCID